MRRSPLVLAALLALLAGCSSVPRKLEDVGPVYTPTNVRGPAAWPETVVRVAVLPAHDIAGRLPSESLATYDPLWQRALGAAQRAELVAVARPELSAWTGRESFASTGLLPAGLLERLTRETGAQAVLFLDLTTVKSYPPLALGFRARLVSLPGGETIWVVDELFDAADAATARGARRHARTNSSAPGDAAHGVLQSPSRFGEYAFHAVAALLPPRPLPTPPPAKPNSSR